MQSILLMQSDRGGAMTTARSTEPEATLAEVRDLRRRFGARAHGGAWLPALAIAALLVASIGLYRFPFTSPNVMEAAFPFWAGLPDEQREPIASYVFWFVGTPLMFGAIAAWYRWRARRVGIRVAWQPVVYVGLGVLILLSVLAAVPRRLPADPDILVDEPPLWVQITGPLTPLLLIALATVALGWVERSRALVVSGIWIGLLTVWLSSTFPLGAIPGGTLSLRPGHYLIIMALPLIVFGVARLARGGK
jgi:hypothetical protein